VADRSIDRAQCFAIGRRGRSVANVSSFYERTQPIILGPKLRALDLEERDPIVLCHHDIEDINVTASGAPGMLEGFRD
jgi:hypothetical protein